VLPHQTREKEQLLLNLTRCMRATVFDWIIFRKNLDIVEEITNLFTMLFEGLRQIILAMLNSARLMLRGRYFNYLL